jgi:hypothetical protein
MLGTYDFCGHYEWTFGWLERVGGPALVREYWDVAIGQDSQRHLASLIHAEQFEGMRKYWSHTLGEESPERAFTISEGPGLFRIDMHDCPSKGFLLRNGLANYHDYCDHCIGWIGPVMKRAGFVIDHEHNHCGQCWWEMRRNDEPARDVAANVPPIESDVRAQPNWLAERTIIDRYIRANAPDAKQPPEGSTRSRS